MNTDHPESRTRRYTRGVIRWRWPIVAASLLLAALAGSGLPRLGLESDYRVFFSDDNPDLLAFDAMENVYTKNDNVLFVVRPREGDVFTPETLEAIRALTDDAWRIPHATRVDAITNFQHTWADGDELVVEDLVPAGAVSEAIVSRAREVALMEPALVGKVVSPDGAATGVNVRIMLPGESEEELRATVAHVRELEARVRAEHPGLEIQTSGISMLNAAFAEAPAADLPFVMPLMFGALTVAIIVFLRSGLGTISTLTVIGLSVATAVGAAGYLGVKFDPTSASAPTIILTLAVADSIHILVSFFHALRRGRDRKEALIQAMEENVQPVFLTSITTAVGFLTLNFSDSPPFRLLGNVTAFGVIVAWLFSMTVLPALMSMLPLRAARPAPSRVNRLADFLGSFVTRHPRRLLGVMAAISLVIVAAIPRLEFNEKYYEYFDDSIAFRGGAEFTIEHLTGLMGTSYSLDSGESQGVSDPEYLGVVARFTEWLRSRPTVVHVKSFSDTMKRLNQNMHGDDPREYRLPADRELAAQFLLLYELSLPYGLDVNDEIDVDKRSLRIDVTYRDVDTSTLIDETRRAEAWLAAHGTPSMKRARATSPALMFANITTRNIDSMLLGTGLGFVLIAIILVVAFKSVRLGLLSLVPNVLPAAMAFGAWALLVGEVGFAVSIIAGLSIGIIVDDTVHFLSKYHRARKRMSAPEAVRYAFQNVGSALLGTTFIVAVGFTMLGLSTFRVTAYMGLLTSLTIVCALVIDFLLLPALLIVMDPLLSRTRSRRSSPSPLPATR